MAPYLLLGFLIAGVLHAFVPQTVYRKYLAGNDLKSVVLSILFGVPLPLCSCGVIPTAVSMRKEGASKGATTAFLIATPQTGVDSIAATWSVFGWPFALLRPVVAMATAFFGGIAENISSRREVRRQRDAASDGSRDDKTDGCGGTCTRPGPVRGFWERCREALRYGFSDMIQDIGRWLVLGLVLAALITAFVPDDFFVAYSGNRFFNMLLVLLVSMPMYVCATGSIPIAAALMLKGLSPGAALVFLMAGPATNMASILVLGKTLGRKSLVIYLVSIIAGAIGFGLLTDGLLPAEWFNAPVREHFHASCCAPAAATGFSGWSEMLAATPWWKTASSLILLVLLARTLVLRFRSKQMKKENTMKSYQVSGMMCNHCKANVQSHLEALEGVKSVHVDLASGRVDVEGDVSVETVVETVKSLGYGCGQL